MYKKIAKKSILVLLGIILIIPIGYLLFFIFIGPTLNNIRAASIERDLLEISLPPETEIIETASYIGNTSGTGNHIEIWAGVLLRSKLKIEEISDFYQDYEIVWAVPADETQYPEPRDYMKFSYLSGNGNRENCYIIGAHFMPTTQNDIRGH